MEIRQGYKQTEAGIIPEEWEVKTLGECFEVIMGQSPSSKSYNEEEDGLPLVQGNADIKNNKVCPRMYTSEITKESYPNDLIMTVRAPVGDVYISDIHSCIGRGICAIRNGNRYLYYYLFNYKDKWERLAQGSTFAAITVKEVKDLNIPIPPLKEQEKIAGILSYYDKAIEQQELLIGKEKEFKKGMMQKIFSQEIRFKDDNGKDYPEWEEKRLGEISDVRDGTHDSPKYVESGYPLVTSKNVKNGKIVLDEVNYISKEDYESINKRSKVSKGDILMGMIGTIGNIALVNKENFAIKNVALIKEKINLKNKFLIQYLQSNIFYKKIKSLNEGGTQKFISLKNIRDLKFLIPTIGEQEKIANFLSNIDDKIELLENKLELLKNEKKGMMQKLLTGEVRV